MATAAQSTPTQTNFIARNWRDLIRPRKLEVESDSLTETYGKFTCEPLERGFGTTLGNSLRRILLSSLQGTAITAVKIESWSFRIFAANATASSGRTAPFVHTSSVRRS